ncbi:ethanolamine kinase 1, partial [Protobothrops mucrosquamatus]|uniref:ethanolamine kinase 1 n=1 Tax=Protobothrops mucrosquamatus TaxID=103944 RepID=UPI0007758B29
MANYIHVPPGSPEVPKLDIFVSERDPSGGGKPGYRRGALELLRRLRPDWKPEEVTLKMCLTKDEFLAFHSWKITDCKCSLIFPSSVSFQRTSHIQFLLYYIYKILFKNVL